MRSPRHKVAIRLWPSGQRRSFDNGLDIYSALASMVPGFAAPCEGRGLCGLCRVRISPAPPPKRADLSLIPAHLLQKGFRLSCLHTLSSPVEITLAEAERKSYRILPGRLLPAPDPWLRARRTASGGMAVYGGVRLIERLAAGPPPSLLAAALDLGTTTLSLQLIDLERPAILGTAAAENPQVRYGEDVLSRITMASRPAGLKILRESAVAAVNRLLAALKSAAGTEAPVYEMAVAANPAMTAIFAGVNPASPSRTKVVPAHMEADRFGLELHPRARVNLLPALGPFVGGDVAAGLAHAGFLSGTGRPAFYLDLGTNGEMVLRAGGRRLAASAAAGPALEGRKISCGMRAEEGAIDSVRVSADVSYTVIGGGPPRGICGSGLLELLSGLLKTGLIHENGRFADETEASLLPQARLARRLRGREGERAFVVAAGPGHDLRLTQGDVRELQLAKGAIRAGVEMLLQEAGAAAEEVARVVVAGTFGYHLNEECLVTTGFIPPSWRGVVEFAGNASLAGAREYLLFRRRRRLIHSMARRVENLNLAARPRFQEIFLRSLGF